MLLRAARLGRRTGLVSINSAFTVIHLERVERYGLGSCIIGIGAIQARVKEFEVEGRALITEGADVVPVVNCTAVALAWVEMDVRLHRSTGILASQGPTFRLAPARAREDFGKA